MHLSTAARAAAVGHLNHKPRRRKSVNTYRPLLAACVVLAFGARHPVVAQSAPAPSSDEPDANQSPPPVVDVAIPNDSATELAKKLQNPIGDLISVPFQNNLNLNVGPHQGTQDILNIQPVIPFHLNEDWNIITRTILPLVWNPSFSPAPSVPFGLAPTNFSAFLSPSKPVDGWIWGVGPTVQIPTNTNASLGSNVWGLGPAAVVVKLAGPIVTGTLVNTVFSLGGTSGPGANKYTLLTINPFLIYNFGGGWFVGTVPIITANLSAGGTKWTLPVGAQFGRLIKIDKLPVNLLIGAYYDPIRPTGGATWQLRTQIAFIF